MKNEYHKRPNQETEFSQEQLIELKKCQESAKYFINNYVYIQNQKQGMMLFKTYPYQDRMLELFQNNRFSLVKVGRQMGKCVTRDTNIKIAHKPTGLKKLLLKLFFKNQYLKMFS